MRSGTIGAERLVSSLPNGQHEADLMTTHPYLCPGFLTAHISHTPPLLPPPPPTPTMASTSQQQKGHDRLISTLDGCIQVVNIAKDACGIPIAQTAFASVSVLLTLIRVRFPSSAKTNLCLTSPRTRWPIIRIMSVLEGLALRCVKRSTEGWRGHHWMHSASPS